jgi:hypothetical protein
MGRPRKYETDAEKQKAYRERKFRNTDTVLRNRHRYVVSVGGGLSSTMALPMKAIANFGRANVDMVMCRLPNEDPDVWKLVDAVENLTGIEVKMVGLNKSPWDIFFELGYINPVTGRGRADPCSKILKREYLATYMRENYDSKHTTLCLGITAHEYSDRWFHIHKNWTKQGWNVAAPLADDPSITRESMMADCERLFGFVPRLYRYGFDHNNCGGACIKAGQAQWAKLLWFLPDIYAWWEENEERFRREVNPNIAILKRQRKGVVSPLTLQEFRLELQEKWNTMLPDVAPFEGLESTAPCSYCEAA